MVLAKRGVDKWLVASFAADVREPDVPGGLGVLLGKGEDTSVGRPRCRVLMPVADRNSLGRGAPVGGFQVQIERAVPIRGNGDMLPDQESTSP